MWIFKLRHLPGSRVFLKTLLLPLENYLAGYLKEIFVSGNSLSLIPIHFAKITSGSQKWARRFPCRILLDKATFNDFAPHYPGHVRSTVISDLIQWKIAEERVLTYRLMPSPLGRSLFRNFPKTFPLPLGPKKSLIKPSDVVKDFGHMKLIRGRLEHAAILEECIRDMQLNEVTNIAAGVKDIPPEILDGLTYNSLRYPVSFFAVNTQDEVVSISCSSIVYKDPKNDPIPPKDVVCKDRSHAYQTVLDLIAIAEKKNISRLNVDKIVQHDLTYTPTTLRGQGISGAIYPVMLKNVIDWSIPRGFRYNIGLATCMASAKNTEKAGYRMVKSLPRELYKKADGSDMELPPEEGTAIFFEMDMLEAKKRGTYDRYW